MEIPLSEGPQSDPHQPSRPDGPQADALRELNRTLEERVGERTREARESERRFQALVHASAQIVWTADASGEASGDPRSWCAATGQSPEERAGWGWLNAVHPDDRAEVRAAWLDAVARECPFERELRLAHVRHGWQWNHVRAVPLHDERGVVRSWIGMCCDVSERKRAESELQGVRSRLTMAEQRERRRVSAILHDDLQQRLYGIQMKITMARQRTGDRDRAALERQLEEAQELIERAVAVTRQLTVDLSPPLLPGEGLADALAWLCTEMKNLHGLEVELVADHGFPIRDQDMRVLLFQSARELLLNVVEHAGTDRARVVLREKDGLILIAVEDSGKGFDPGGPARSAGAPGRLGLVGVRERLGLFGGRLEIVSSPGSGTRVTAIMPVDA